MIELTRYRNTRGVTSIDAAAIRQTGRTPDPARRDSRAVWLPANLPILVVVMGEAPTCRSCRAPFPYVALMDRARQSTGNDLPLSEGDLYRCENDAAIAARTAALQALVKQDPNNPAAALELVRLQVITDSAPNQVRPLAKTTTLGRLNGRACEVRSLRS